MRSVSTAIIISALLITEASAQITEKIAANCSVDYFRFCTAHSLDSPDAVQCLRSKGIELSKPCIDTLMPAETVTAVEVPETVLLPDIAKDISTKIRTKIKTAVAAVERVIVPARKAKSKPKTKNKSAVVAAAKKPKAKTAKANNSSKNNNFEKQNSGKWKGLPLRLEWRDDLRDVSGGEITPYGYRDRLR